MSKGISVKVTSDKGLVQQTVDGPSTFTVQSDVSTAISYTPETPSNWPSGSVPTTLDEALDILIASGSAGDDGITELTGDVSAGPGNGSQSATVVGIQGIPVSTTAPSPGFTLSYDGTEWVPAIEGFEYFFGGSLTQNPAANVYSSWSDMLASIALQPTGVTPIIWITENTTVPSGTWNLRAGTLRSPFLITGAVTLVVPAGSTLDNLEAVENGLVLELQPTVAGESLTWSTSPNVQILVIGLSALVLNTGSAPAWVSPGVGATVVLAVNAVPWNAFPPLSAPILEGNANGTDTIINNNLVALAPMPDNWLSGNGSLIALLPINALPPSLPGFSGTITNVQSQVVYPATSALYAGRVITPPVASNGSYNCTRGDEFVRVAPTGVGPISITLPDAAGFSGQLVVVKKTTADTTDAVVISSAGGNVEGGLTYALPSSGYSTLCFKSDGTGWWVVGAEIVTTAGSYENANITVDAQGRITAASSGLLGYFDALAKPITPNAADVECSESVSGLTLWDPSNNGSTLTFDNGTALLTVKRRSANSWTAAYKTVPSGSWSAWSKVTLQAPSNNGERAFGMIIWDSAPDTSSDFQYIFSYANNITTMKNLYVQRWTDWQTLSTTQVNAVAYDWIAYEAWFRVRYDSSTPRLSYDISSDGISWSIVHTTTSPLFTPSRVGIVGVRGSSDAADGDAKVRFPFLRFSASADFDQLCLGRVI